MVAVARMSWSRATLPLLLSGPVNVHSGPLGLMITLVPPVLPSASSQMGVWLEGIHLRVLSWFTAGTPSTISTARKIRPMVQMLL
jgi:hypothetical protein